MLYPHCHSVLPVGGSLVSILQTKKQICRMSSCEHGHGQSHLCGACSVGENATTWHSGPTQLCSGLFLFQRGNAIVQQPLPFIHLLLRKGYRYGPQDRKQLDSAVTQRGNWLSPGLMPATSRINKQRVGTDSDLGCLPGAQASTDDTSESPLSLCPHRSILFSKTQINEIIRMCMHCDMCYVCLPRIYSPSSDKIT